MIFVGDSIRLGLVRILLLDTAHRESYVALGEDEKVVAFERLSSKIPHSEAAAPAVDKLLGGQLPDLIAVGVGPGSFTGLRVGMALAKGMHLGAGIPLLPFCSLMGYRGGVAAFDARAGGAYIFDGEPKQVPIKNLPQVKLVGPDAEILAERTGLECEYVEADLDFLMKWAFEQRDEAGEECEALYMKKTAAERALEE